MRIMLVYACLMASAVTFFALVAPKHSSAEVPSQAPPVISIPQQAPAVCDCKVTGVCTCGPDCRCELVNADVKGCCYVECRAQALASGKPLIVWVGCACVHCERALPDCLHCHCDTFPDVPGMGVVVSKPSGGRLLWLQTLPCGCSVDQIKQALNPPSQSSYGNCSSCYGGSCSSGSCGAGGCSSCGSSGRGFGRRR